jgi:hypothetical protein
MPASVFFLHFIDAINTHIDQIKTEYARPSQGGIAVRLREKSPRGDKIMNNRM